MIQTVLLRFRVGGGDSFASQSSIRPGDDSDRMAGLDWPLMSRGRNPVFALEMIQTDIDLETSLFEYNLSQSSIRPGDDSDRGLLRFRGGGGDNLSQSSIRPGDDSDDKY